MNLGNDYQWLVASQKEKLLDIMCPPRQVYSTTYETALPQNQLEIWLDFQRQLQKARNTGGERTNTLDDNAGTLTAKSRLWEMLQNLISSTNTLQEKRDGRICRSKEI